MSVLPTVHGSRHAPSLEKHTVVVSDTGAKQCTAVGGKQLQCCSLYLWGAGSIVYALLRILAKIAILTLRIQELLLAAASVHSSSLLCFHMVTAVYLFKLSLWMSTSKNPTSNNVNHPFQ